MDMFPQENGNLQEGLVSLGGPFKRTGYRVKRCTSSEQTYGYCAVKSSRESSNFLRYVSLRKFLLRNGSSSEHYGGQSMRQPLRPQHVLLSAISEITTRRRMSPPIMASPGTVGALARVESVEVCNHTRCIMTAVIRTIGPSKKISQTAVSGGDAGRTRGYTPRPAYLLAVLATCFPPLAEGRRHVWARKAICRFFNESLSI